MDMKPDPYVKHLSLGQCCHLSMRGIRAAFEKLPNLVSLDVARLNVSGLAQVLLKKLEDKRDPLKNLFITIMKPRAHNIRALAFACPEGGRVLIYNPEQLSEQDKEKLPIWQDIAKLRRAKLITDKEEKEADITLKRTMSAPKSMLVRHKPHNKGGPKASHLRSTSQARPSL